MQWVSTTLTLRQLKRDLQSKTNYPPYAPLKQLLLIALPPIDIIVRHLSFNKSLLTDTFVA